VMGLPAVFLPFPHHADRQQEKNAAAMKRTGAAIVLDEKVTGVAELRLAITSFVDDEHKRREAALASARLGRPDAAQQIADALREMTR